MAGQFLSNLHVNHLDWDFAVTGFAICVPASERISIFTRSLFAVKSHPDGSIVLSDWLIANVHKLKRMILLDGEEESKSGARIELQRNNSHQRATPFWTPPQFPPRSSVTAKHPRKKVRPMLRPYNTLRQKLFSHITNSHYVHEFQLSDNTW